MAQLLGIALSRYRSLGDGLQFIDPLSKVNLLAGPNNSGKSNVLRYVQGVLGPIAGSERVRLEVPSLSGLDVPLGLDQRTEFALAVSIEDAVAEIIEDARLAGWTEQFRQILGSEAFQLTSNDLVWVRFEVTPSGERATIQYQKEQLDSAIDSVPRVRTAMQEASRAATGASGGTKSDDLRRILEQRLHLFKSVPRVETIHAFRQVASEGEDFSGYSGDGIIAGLGRLQDPDAMNYRERTKFEAINLFLKVVLEDDTAQLRIPYHRKTVNVDLGGKILPLESLGTGIHHVLILAAAATLLDSALVCVEEPESHIHPVLQRKLLRYISSATTNRYLIATHSAHLLDTSLASVFRVSLTDGLTGIRPATTSTDLADLCADLGYRPSDLLQANAVVWVEGPSDRLYLRHWMSLADPELIEGVHYSIMFYGGRLLNHLSPDDPDVRDFISLRRLNRNIAILIDSDRRSQQGRLSDTKTRVRDGFNEGPGFAWVTRGYTIENYVPPEVLALAVRTAHPRLDCVWRGDVYANPLSPPNVVPRTPSHRNTPPEVDKVAIARDVIARWDSQDGWSKELSTNVQACSSFVRRANGMPTRNNGERLAS